jgi:3',5'-cyclic AMP phosphodiesterase CpdA
MRYRLLFAATLAVLTCSAQTKTEEAAFVVKPYLQIGKNPSARSLDLLWQTADEEAIWSVEIKGGNSKNWISEPKPEVKTVAAPNLPKRRIYLVNLQNLAAGTTFTYRIIKNKKSVFSDSAKALKDTGQSFRFVAMGDIGAGTADAKLIAQQAFHANPDLVVIPGDIVYEHGLITEYDRNFWPVYNADSASNNGAPLMRSIPFAAAPGNHDTEDRNFNNYPDALAYFLFWDQPINGPQPKDASAVYPDLIIADSLRRSFVATAGDRFPVMTNFSFNYGNAHFLFLDADTYVDWTNEELQQWINRDLENASSFTWKFVVYHHPGFSSSREHFEQQQMRLLAPLFEKGKVDVVFSGHVHNYQRSLPMSFSPDKKGTLLIGGKDNKTFRGRVVNGRWTLDKNFDGVTNTKANGVIYIVTGAGGQELYNPEQNNDPDSWQKFTAKFVSNAHSLSVIDVDGKTFTLRQVDTNGNPVDQFTIKKD